MHFILFCSYAIVAVTARPDVSHGYKYERGNNDNYVGELPLRSMSNLGTQLNQNSGLSGFTSGSLSSFSTSNSAYNSGGTIGTIGTNLGNNYDRTDVSQQSFEPIIMKYFYVHSAPDETQQTAVTRKIQIGRPQKTYRVVFIKAPNYSGQSAAIQPIYPKNEEKTVIYVLTKKPDDADVQDLVTPAPVQPSKPEVYFIKYKTHEEATLAQKKIQDQYDALGGTSDFSDEGIAPVTSVIGDTGNSESVGSGQFSGITSTGGGSASYGSGGSSSGGQIVSSIKSTYLPAAN